MKMRWFLLVSRGLIPDLWNLQSSASVAEEEEHFSGWESPSHRIFDSRSNHERGNSHPFQPQRALTHRNARTRRRLMVTNHLGVPKFPIFFLFMIYSSHFYHQVFHGDHCGFPAKSFFSSGDSPLISTLSFSKFFFFFPVVVLHWQLARQLTLPRKAQQSSRLSRRRHAFLRPRPRPPPAAPPPRRRRRRRCAGGAGGGGGGHLQGVAGAVHPHRHAPPAARPRCPLHW